jgi:predicted phosphate transport protein (TIGR00153 family)
MKFLWKKEKSIMEKIDRYVVHIDSCFSLFREFLATVFAEHDYQTIRAAADAIHQAESLADDERRDIEYELYNKALIPESRGDLLGLLETMDKVANKLEALSYHIGIQRVYVPDRHHADFFLMVEKSKECWEAMKRCLLGMFYAKDVMDDLDRIDTLESDCDVIGRKMLEQIFMNESLDKADKLQLRDVIDNLGDVTDRIQTASDRLTIALMKRKI